MSKSRRQKAAKAAHRARADHLRATMGIAVNGRDLKPGSREYEKALKEMLESTSPDELVRRPRNA